MTVATSTTTVVPTTSGRLGQVTFLISELVSRKNSRVVSHHSRGFATIELSSLFATSVAMNHSPVCAECAVLGARVPSGLRAPSTIHFVWQAKRDSNPQPAVLETAALPI